MKKIAVIMSVFNEKNEYLTLSIESILNQTYKEFDFIIVDDGTSKENKEIIKKYRLQDERIIVIENKENIGLVKSLNKAINYTNAKYIARMDSDDVSHSDRLEKQLKYMEKNKQYTLIGTRCNYMNNNGVYMQSKFYGEVSKEMLAKFCVFFHPSIMVNTSILKKVHGYDNYLRNEDYALYFKLYTLGYKGYVIKDVLLDYRQDMNSFKRKKYADRIIEAKIRKKYLKILNISYIKRVIYTIKPLVAGCVPGKVMYLYKKYIVRGGVK